MGILDQSARARFLICPRLHRTVRVLVRWLVVELVVQSCSSTQRVVPECCSVVVVNRSLQCTWSLDTVDRHVQLYVAPPFRNKVRETVPAQELSVTLVSVQQRTVTSPPESSRHGATTEPERACPGSNHQPGQ
jgi:hypothetical protein